MVVDSKADDRHWAAYNGQQHGQRHLRGALAKFTAQAPCISCTDVASSCLQWMAARQSCRAEAYRLKCKD